MKSAQTISIKNVEKTYLLGFYVLHVLFMKESWLGRSWLFQDSEKKLKREQKQKLNILKKKEPIYDFSSFISKVTKQDALQIDDVSIYGYRFIKEKDFIECRTKGNKRYAVFIKI